LTPTKNQFVILAGNGAYRFPFPNIFSKSFLHPS
jgi:hypothetical protein